MFGREVRRVITVERRQTEGGAIESESRTHGWYLESDSLPPGMRAQPGVLLGAVYGQASPAFKINRRGLVEKGLPVSVTTRMSVRADRHFDRSSEVTELFEGRLDPALFEPPPGFRRVFHFDNFAATWQNRLLMQWEWLQDWFTGLRR